MKLFHIARAFNKEYLKVSPLHKIYLEEAGNPKGIPVVHLHGGPGSHSSPRHTKFYNPASYRIILFDQRGCGKSLPLGEVRENTTDNLVEDMEKIRKHLGIDKWIVSGGSWGATLALAYSEKYPERVTAILVRGVFTFRKFEIDWVEKSGANYFFPEAWERFKGFIPKTEQGDLAKAYAKRVFGNDKERQLEAVRRSNEWEMSIANLVPKDPKPLESNLEVELASTKVFYHYEVNGAFMSEGELLKNAYKLKGIPGVIIQGRYDMICPPITAWELHKAWPDSRLEIVLGGHHNSNAALWKKFIEYTEVFAEEFGE
jgi:proline iminopeptidase